MATIQQPHEITDLSEVIRQYTVFAETYREMGDTVFADNVRTTLMKLRIRYEQLGGNVQDLPTVEL